MFEFLKQLDERLYVRYQTLERNIKAASNSFYDSFLDLQDVRFYNGIERSKNCPIPFFYCSRSNSEVSKQ